MAPPTYYDLGKDAGDIFKKGYNFSFIRLDCKTKTNGGAEFFVSGNSNTETGKVSAALETKYKVPDYGVVIKEKWTTDNVLNAEVSLEDKPLKGSKIALFGTFVPNTGKKACKLLTSMKAENISVNADVELNPKGPVIHGASVLGLKGWLFGSQASFDTLKNKLVSCNFAVGYATKDFVLNTVVNDGQEFGATVYQKVNPNLETGITVGWAAGNNATNFSIGGVYTLDKDTSLRAKMNHNTQMGFGITHRLRDGIKLSLCALIDGRNFNQGGHKLGLGLDLEA